MWGFYRSIDQKPASRSESFLTVSWTVSRRSSSADDSAVRACTHKARSHVRFREQLRKQLGGARSPLGLGTFAAVNVIGINRTLVAAPRSAVWRTRLLLGIDRGKQSLHRALRRHTECLIQVDRLDKLLADQV